VPEILFYKTARLLFYKPDIKLKVTYSKSYICNTLKQMIIGSLFINFVSIFEVTLLCLQIRK